MNVNHNVSTPSGRFILYRVLDSDGALLYVGATTNPELRMAAHERLKDWWKDATTITLEHFSTVEELMAAEKTAIQNENPEHNFIYSPTRDAPWARKPRARAGSGTVFQRSDGYWIARLEVSPGANGKRRVKQFCSIDREVAISRLEAYRAQMASSGGQ